MAKLLRLIFAPASRWCLRAGYLQIHTPRFHQSRRVVYESYLVVLQSDPRQDAPRWSLHSRLQNSAYQSYPKRQLAAHHPGNRRRGWNPHSRVQCHIHAGLELFFSISCRTHVMARCEPLDPYIRDRWTCNRRVLPSYPATGPKSSRTTIYCREAENFSFTKEIRLGLHSCQGGCCTPSEQFP